MTPRLTAAANLPIYVEPVPNHKSPSAILICPSPWDKGIIRKTTLANIAKLSALLVDQIALLNGRVGVGPAASSVYPTCSSRSGPYDAVGSTDTTARPLCSRTSAPKSVELR